MKDAQEFFQYLLDTVSKKERISGEDPSKICSFKLENRVQCMNCEQVSYQTLDTNVLILPIFALKDAEWTKDKPIYVPVNMSDCLDRVFESDIREFNCPKDLQKTMATLYGYI
jgi:uncharacterized UBP type Zn finger protein